MGLTMREKQAVTREMALEYKRATKQRKGEILDSLVGLTEYNRSYAARVLRQRSREVVVGSGRVGDVKFTLVEDQRSPRKKRRKRPRVYGKEVLVPLQRVWGICDGICGKRLAPYLAEIVPKLERLGELTLADGVRRKLIRISPATIDRLLAPGPQALPAESAVADQAGNAAQASDPDPDVERLERSPPWVRRDRSRVSRRRRSAG